MTRQEMKEGFRGWHERGYLPHRDEQGLTQFVTFRLADSFPASLRSEWEHLWKIESEGQRRRELESYLDRGRGCCHLRRADIADVVESALRYFDRQRYELRAWVVMPNHVHVLFKVMAMPMSEVVGNWKKYTSHEANKILGTQGRFWEEDYWDTYMRNSEHELKSRKYIENNPSKVKLTLEPRHYPWSSARFRNISGKLLL